MCNGICLVCEPLSHINPITQMSGLFETKTTILRKTTISTSTQILFEIILYHSLIHVHLEARHTSTKNLRYYPTSTTPKILEGTNRPTCPRCQGAKEACASTLTPWI